MAEESVQDSELTEVPRLTEVQSDETSNEQPEVEPESALQPIVVDDVSEINVEVDK
ncbi:hypothetical protein [Nocardia sp. NPDC004604]|uniref:hypothetical protein n=1 Tax=Nocardia sp. NPDC004604 TaxID=3157013 RepID=UPI0033ABACCE